MSDLHVHCSKEYVIQSFHMDSLGAMMVQVTEKDTGKSFGRSWIHLKSERNVSKRNDYRDSHYRAFWAANNVDFDALHHHIRVSHDKKIVKGWEIRNWPEGTQDRRMIGRVGWRMIDNTYEKYITILGDRRSVTEWNWDLMQEKNEIWNEFHPYERYYEPDPEPQRYELKQVARFAHSSPNGEEIIFEVPQGVFYAMDEIALCMLHGEPVSTLTMRVEEAEKHAVALRAAKERAKKTRRPALMRVEML